jgi:hypothetical protein
MSSDRISRWTAILTNIAVVIGLVFVGLEFRSNTRSIEAERIDSFMSGWNDVYAALLQSDRSSEIYHRGYADPESLTAQEESVFNLYLQLSFNNFERIYRARNLGLIPDDIWESHRAGIGFAFLSELGRDTVRIMLDSGLNNPMWGVIDQSTKDALAYCLDDNNRCVQPMASVRP